MQLDLNVLKEVSDHPNLAKLIGCCMRFAEVFLVYEFMPRRNLFDFLESGSIEGLPLERKVKILVGIARGMVFLKEKRAEMLGNVHQIRAMSESWFDRHKAFIDEEDFKGDDYENYNPWSCKRTIRLHSDDIWGNTIDKYRLQRCKIMLDKDYTAKLSNYEGTDKVYVHGHFFYGRELMPTDPLQLENNVSGFTVVVAEVLIGRKICDREYLEKIDDYLREHGKKSFSDIAELCFEICNEVDSESRMLTVLEDCDYEDLPIEW